MNSIILTIGDPLLGWMLGLDRNIALFIVAIGTALILTLVRLFTTNQNLLGRCKKDKARLKQLMREAKKTGDKDAVARYRTTTGQIGMKSMKAERETAFIFSTHDPKIVGEAEIVYTLEDGLLVGREDRRTGDE